MMLPKYKELYSQNEELKYKAIDAYATLLKLMVETWEACKDKPEDRDSIAWNIEDVMDTIRTMLSEDIYRTLMATYRDKFEHMNWYCGSSLV